MVAAHCRQNTDVANPRRFSSTSACSPLRQPLLDRVVERPAEHDVRALRRVLLAHVDDRHGGERPVEDPALQDDALEPARHRVVVGLHRRRRRAEHDQRAGALRAHDRHVAAVVARALFLLVRAVVLLVDDDQAEPVERREDRRTGADDDLDVAAPDPLPLIVALAVGEAAVLDRRRDRRRPGGTARRPPASGRSPARASARVGPPPACSADRRR